MKARSGEKIRLASVEELLGVPDEQGTTEIELSRIQPFQNHPFYVRDDEQMDNLVESIKVLAETNFDDIKKLDNQSLRKWLISLKGIGPKVADCCLLFSHHHTSAFPKDVWIKRAMSVLFGDELPENAQEYAGIAQQYIFFYARDTKLLDE